jgi:hypothetical protein
MRKPILRWVTLLTLLSVTVAALAVLLVQQQGAAKSQHVKQTKQKKLREIAMERDVEVEGVSESHSEYPTFEELTKDAAAIVYGRIIDSRSFFDESGDPVLEYGELITTEYTVDVLRVLKDKTSDTLPPRERPQPAPLNTPLKIARNGGVVYVNGHRAAVKVKGFESLEPGKQYVFFLFWSPDYKAYVFAGGLSGAVMVNDDLSLKALASSKEIQARLRGIDLESLFKQVK